MAWGIIVTIFAAIVVVLYQRSENKKALSKQKEETDRALVKQKEELVQRQKEELKTIKQNTDKIVGWIRKEHRRELPIDVLVALEVLEGVGTPHEPTINPEEEETD